MKKKILGYILLLFFVLALPRLVIAQTEVESTTLDVSNHDMESTVSFEKTYYGNVLSSIINEQRYISLTPYNAIKYAIIKTVDIGIPVETIVMLLLLPLVALVIAASRHIIGIRGFGIFLPASLAVVFAAIGPVVGLILFISIVVVSTLVRLLLRKLKFRLQYLPRMSLILLFVVLGVMLILFLASVLRIPYVFNVSIFPVLFLILLSEDFTRVQIGKSLKTAFSLTSETLILALISFIILTLQPVQIFALRQPESLLLGVAIADILLGRFVGLRVMEMWRFRKLISR